MWKEWRRTYVLRKGVNRMALGKKEVEGKMRIILVIPIAYLLTIVVGTYVFMTDCFRTEFSILFSLLGVCGGGILMRNEKYLKWGWFYLLLTLLVALTLCLRSQFTLL